MAMHPVVLASGILSTALLVSAFGPRLLPAEDATAAPAAQACLGSTGYYKPGLEELNTYDNAFAAFQAEVMKPAIDNGESLDVLDFEITDTGTYFFYSTRCS